RTDKLSEALPARVEAFIGWSQDWQVSDYEGRIRELYQKRSTVVHRGARDAVSMVDVLFSDELIVNVLMNIVRHPSLFGSKAKVVEFSEKVRAERLLGVRPRVRPKTLQMLGAPPYGPED